MNELPNNKANKPRRWLRSLVLAWLLCFVAMTLLIIIADAVAAPYNPTCFQQISYALVGASLLLGLWLAIRWSCQRLNLGRLLVGCAIFFTLVTIFYQEEDWRGQRAWTQCKAQLEADGLAMDWNKCIPPAVPDDQNFFMASNILLRFKKPQGDAEIKLAANNPWLNIQYASNSFPVFVTTRTNPLLVATLLVATNTDSDHVADLRVKWQETNTAANVQGLLATKLGRSVNGAAGFMFSELQLSNLTPVHIALETETPRSVAQLSQLIPKNLVTNLGQFQITALGEDRFQVLLTNTRVTLAADYLHWSEQYVLALNEVRAALQRPGAVLPGDYSRPYLIPIPNFVTLRAVAQTLAMRAQCDFLLQRPDEALHELTLMHDLCRILAKPPTGRPETLVEAMINVAISGLYAATVAEGFRLHVWQEPQCTALQAQLQAVHAPTLVRTAFQHEINATATTLQRSTPAELQKLLWHAPLNFWDKITGGGYWLLHLIPQGWIYQNMVVAASLGRKTLPVFDPANDLIHPELAMQMMTETEKTLVHRTLWNWWAGMSIPNYAKAYQTTAYQQTMVNEGQIACALECYHLAHAEYPASLTQLMPQYLEQLPHDLIGGDPLHYHRTEDGKFLLYSIGWNEADDGGKPGTLSDVKTGDWVWPN